LICSYSLGQSSVKINTQKNHQARGLVRPISCTQAERRRSSSRAEAEKRGLCVSTVSINPGGKGVDLFSPIHCCEYCTNWKLGLVSRVARRLMLLDEPSKGRASSSLMKMAEAQECAFGSAASQEKPDALKNHC
jgi:hypothetical protein